MKADRILIIGGGASGVILAAHLLKFGPETLGVALVERRPHFGAGIAYSTDEPDHLLNTRASGMSAYPDDADHFWRWLTAGDRATGIDCSDPFCFVPRRLYRAYLGDILGTAGGRLQLIEGECTSLTELRGGVAATLKDGRTELADRVVLATGHAEPRPEPDSGVVGPWLGLTELGLAEDDDVAIIGTGLSMVDNVAQLRRSGHRGRITAVSRRGLLPHVHTRHATPFLLDAADIPFGTSPTYLLRWLRQAAAWHAGRGGDWRDLIDAVRPHTQALWQSMSVDARARFLRHARTFWEVHRHRMAPQAAQALQEAIDDGQLHVVAGRVVDWRSEAGHTELTVRKRDGAPATLRVRRVIDCTGILRNPMSGSNTLAAELVRTGRARLDPLRIGIETDETGAVLDAEGRASRRLFGVGPVTRALFWEVTAIPDIRVQCAALATRLAGTRIA
ncbi:FAD/NAD(P)-binding protein [Aureimonas altamirensis]|uniref:FAD/NAD(P)-binding protein n=1 Tax=Aureimonas altamirensis TaxID=370622 RepID=UPI0020373908|nr:FAD/NAD(P)-binding protein [Aureimonas altamirensis]